MNVKISEQSIVIGCNYHVKWQSQKGMRFVLCGIKGQEALLRTRRSDKKFWTKKSDLIFIMSEYNIKKAERILTDNQTP